MTFKGPFQTKGFSDSILWFYPYDQSCKMSPGLHLAVWLPQTEELVFLMRVTATATRLLLRKIAKYYILCLENCEKLLMTEMQGDSFTKVAGKG